jgi:hypothetical protein
MEPCYSWQRGLEFPFFFIQSPDPHVLRKLAGVHHHCVAPMNRTGSQITITGFCEVGKALIQE